MTETQTLTLTEFLLARIAEDEAVANGPSNTTVLGNGGWYHDRTWHPWKIDEHNCDERSGPLLQIDPARVLADIEAKRRIVGWHESAEGCCDERHGKFTLRDGALEAGGSSSGDLSIRQPIGFQPYIGCVTLMHLASVYAEHPDYREEWRA